MDQLPHDKFIIHINSEIWNNFWIKNLHQKSTLKYHIWEKGEDVVFILSLMFYNLFLIYSINQYIYVFILLDHNQHCQDYYKLSMN